MTLTTTAVYDNGSFTPELPLSGLPEHAVVRLTVEELDMITPEVQKAMLEKVPPLEEFADAIEEGRRRPWLVEEF